MACQRTMLTSCLSKQAHYKGCYKAHTSDQAGNATGTVFPTFSLTSCRGPLAEWATTTLSEQGRQQTWEKMEGGQ